MGAYNVLNYRIAVDFFENYCSTVIKFLYKYRHRSICYQKLYLPSPLGAWNTQKSYRVCTIFYTALELCSCHCGCLVWNRMDKSFTWKRLSFPYLLHIYPCVTTICHVDLYLKRLHAFYQLYRFFCHSREYLTLMSSFQNVAEVYLKWEFPQKNWWIVRHNKIRFKIFPFHHEFP